MKVQYISPLFRNADGSPRVTLVPPASVKTYARRDAAVLRLQALGGIHAPATDETRKLINTIRSAKRKIDREMWFSEPVAQ